MSAELSLDEKRKSKLLQAKEKSRNGKMAQIRSGKKGKRKKAAGKKKRVQGKRIDRRRRIDKKIPE